jgi:hypothetical protein
MNITSYSYVGKTYKNCDPSAGQKAALSSDQGWQATLHNSYQAVFQAGSSIFNNLKGKLDSIIANPQGYSPTDLATQQSQSINAAAASAKAVNQAIGAKAAVSGAVPGVESGVTQATRAAADTSILNNESNQQAGILQSSARLASERQQTAVQQEEGLTGSAFNPSTSVGGQVSEAEKVTQDQANQNAATSQQWIGVAGGLADSAVAGLTGGGIPKPKAPTSSAPSSGGGPDGSDNYYG